jgi:hypothetical protein
MENIEITKHLLEEGEDIKVNIELSLWDLIIIYNACADIVNEHPQMIGYEKLGKRIKKIVEPLNK